MRVSSFVYMGLGLGALAVAVGLFFHIQKGRVETGALEPFVKACVEPVLAGKDDVGAACRSAQAIADTYNVDIKAHIEARHALMKATARRIAGGELLKPQDYKACIASGQCAEVPLLPHNVDPEKMTAEQRLASEAFWDLAEQDRMTRRVCDLIPECRAMGQLKVIDGEF